MTGVQTCALPISLYDTKLLGGNVSIFHVEQTDFHRMTISGGTALIGLNKPVIKAHGASNAEAIENAVGQAKQFAQSGLIADIEANIDLMRVEKE